MILLERLLLTLFAVSPFISEELWNKGNKLMDERSATFITDDFKTKIIGSKKNGNILTSKILCGLCGKNYWRSNGFKSLPSV